MLLVRLCHLQVPRQWGESALKTSRLPGALSLLAKSSGYTLPQLGTGDNRPIRSSTPWNNRRGSDTSDNWKINRRECRTRRPPILISLTCTLRSDQCLTALGRHSRRRQVPKVVRQNEQRQTHPVGHEPMARQPSPVQGVLALFDPLLGCPSSIVETHHSFGASRHVRDDEAHPREQLSPMPLHLGHHPPCMVPTLSTIPKVVV